MGKQTKLSKQGKRVLPFKTDEDIENNLVILTKAWNNKPNEVLKKAMKRGLNEYAIEVIGGRLENKIFRPPEIRTEIVED